MATPTNEPITPAPAVSTAPTTTPVSSTGSVAAPTPAAPSLSGISETINPRDVYSGQNIGTVLNAKIPDIKTAKLGDLEKQIAKAQSVAELNQVDIKNQPVNMNVISGQSAHMAGLFNARLNALSGAYEVKQKELARKEAEKQQFISTYGADPDQRPKGMSKNEFIKQLAAGKFNNLLTLDYRTKQAELKKALTPAAGTTGTWSIETDPTTGEQYMFNNKTAERKPVGSVAPGVATTTVSPEDQLIQAKLSANAGKVDGYANPADYMQLRDTYVNQSGATDNAGMIAAGAAFDAKFGKMLNPNDAPRLGVNPVTTQSNIPQEYTSFLANKTPEQQAAFLGMNPTDRSNVQQLVNGDVLLSDLIASRGVEGSALRQRLLKQARLIDPTFSENENKRRYTFQQQWFSPQSKSFATRTSINTAMGHVAQLKQDADAIDNGTIQKYNTIADMLKKETGNDAVTNFNYTLTQVASEIAAAYKNGNAPTDQEVEQERAALAYNFSPEQFQGVFDRASKLLSSKITAMAEEYKGAMNKYPDDPIVQNFALEEMKQAGIDISPIVKSLKAQGYQINPDLEQSLNNNANPNTTVSSELQKTLDKYGLKF